MAKTGYLNLSKAVCFLVVFFVAECDGFHAVTVRTINCRTPVVRNGYVIECDRKFEPGDVASIQCKEGYRNVGSTRLRCSRLGTWTDNTPQCEEIRCGKLPYLLNGTIFPDQPVLPRSYVNISCNKKFILHGPEVLLCTDDGSWEPYEMMYCEELHCPRLPQLLNGLVQPREPTRPGKVEFSCNHGFTLKGPTSLTCQSDGEWVPNVMPFCRDIKCRSLPNLANGIIHKNSSVFTGDSVTFSCNPDYILKGPNRMICSANGTWEPYEMVYCAQQPEKQSETFNILMSIWMCASFIGIVVIAITRLKLLRIMTKNDKQRLIEIFQAIQRVKK